MSILNMSKGNSSKVWLIGIVVAIFLIYLTASGIIDKMNQDSNSHNVAVAAKAKADLERSVENNNRQADEIAKLKATMVEQKILEEKVDELTKYNNELVSKPIEKIKRINNTKIVYKEEPSDVEKSKIIINGIWEAYNKGVRDEKDIK